MTVFKWALLGSALLTVCGSHAIAQGYSKISKPDARVLASNCMQCHATKGQPYTGGNTSLVNTTYSKLRQQMLDLQSKIADTSPKTATSDPQKDIMIRHAKTYSLDEIEAIASFLSGIN